VVVVAVRAKPDWTAGPAVAAAVPAVVGRGQREMAILLPQVHLKEIMVVKVLRALRAVEVAQEAQAAQAIVVQKLVVQPVMAHRLLFPVLLFFMPVAARATENLVRALPVLKAVWQRQQMQEQIQAVAAAVMGAMAVQALSFFVTPMPRNAAPAAL
jgi:hypothetical protein